MTGNNPDSRADAVPIALHADRLDQDRIVFVAAIISEHLRGSVQIIDHYVNIAIVINVAKGSAPARTLFSERRAQLLSDFGKGAVTAVVMHEIALPVGG